MVENLNVNKNNLNNKRLSRLQGVILKALATSYPAGYPKRILPRIVAHLYGKGSIITVAHNEAELKQRSIGLERTLTEIQRLLSSFKGHDEWIAPKFSVSYSRSIRALLNQGLVTYISTTSRGVWALFITDKGLAKIQNRKVKVNAKFWDAFQASLKDKQTGANLQS